MNIDIRTHILNNFKDISKEEMKESIMESIEEKDDIILPGFGVFFEILWNGSDETLKENILDVLVKKINE